MEYQDKVPVPYYISKVQELETINRNIAEKFLFQAKKNVLWSENLVSDYNNNILEIQRLNMEQPLTKEEDG